MMQLAYILCTLIAGVWCSRNESIALVQRHASVTTLRDSTVPIHRYYAAYSTGDHFYSKSATVPHGYYNEGVEFNAFATQVTGTVPIYRFYNHGHSGDHYYTKSATTPAGYVAEGVEFYAFASQAHSTVPIHRYFNPTTGDHYYAKTATTPGGYVFEGVEFYAYANPASLPTPAPTNPPTNIPRATLKLNRKLADDADVRQMYDDLADAGDDCVHFPISSDGCGEFDCSKGTNHHVTCDWSRTPASVTGTQAPYTITANGLVQQSSSGCITANSCVMGMFETTKYTALCAGDTIEATYSAAQGGDWFEVAMGLYEGTPGYNPTFIEKMIYRGSAVSNAIASFTIPRQGDYFVRLFGASYDRTGGTVLGATLTLESEFEVVGDCSAKKCNQQNQLAPTPWPTPPPTPAPPQPQAVGDPHLINSRGERFNIFKTGQMEFLRVPYESVTEKADFTALATIQAVAETDNKCDEADYITGMRFGGSWLKGKSLEIKLEPIPFLPPGAVQKKVTVLLGGDQVTQSSEPIDVGEHHYVQLIWNHDEQVVLKVGGASVDMKLHHYYLNVEANSFKSLGSKIGGLLGEDDHTDVSTPPQECQSELMVKASRPDYSSARMMP